MKDILVWLTVAKDEIETLITYVTLLNETAETEKANVEPRLREIMGDEYNHALIGLLSAATESGIKIPTDELEELLNSAFAEESDNDD